MSPTSKIAICDLKGANMKKIKKMKKLLYSMEKLFHFLHFFHFFPRLNRKTRFSRSEILKNLNICPSKDRHLTCYTCYRFYDFLQYGLMDLVKSFFKWCMIYNFNRKSQKALMSCHFIPETELFRKQVAELCFPATLYNFIILYYRENRN